MLMATQDTGEKEAARVGPDCQGEDPDRLRQE